MTTTLTLTTGTPAAVVDGSPTTVILGTDPYGDGTDTTYTTTYGTADPSTGGLTVCTLANLTDPREPTDFVTWCRIAATAGRSPATVALRIQDYGGGGLINGMIGAPVSDGSTQEFTFRASVDDPGNLAFYVNALRTGDLHIEVRNSFDVGEFITVYGATVSVEYSSASFPLRRYPPVNNGGSGPTRHWPRTVNRRAGGTY